MCRDLMNIGRWREKDELAEIHRNSLCNEDEMVVLGDWKYSHGVWGRLGMCEDV